MKVIADGKGHYIGGLKGNQQLFHEEVELLISEGYLTRIRERKVNFRTYTEKAHNRIET